jgi:hypothetical protein
MHDAITLMQIAVVQIAMQAGLIASSSQRSLLITERIKVGE